MPATRYPGAVWRPTDDDGAMTEVRGVSLHEAVTRAEESIFGWVQQEHAAHWFVGRYGNCEQYIEVGRKAAGVKDGNPTMLTVETWDGLQPGIEVDVDGRGPNQTVWTPQQCERLADLIAWLHIEWGIPVRLMASSARSERGVAPHRWGVDPWRALGGELWTKHPGKSCPGSLRIAQIPAILSRANDLAGIQGYRPIAPGRITSTPPASFDAATFQEDDMPTIGEFTDAMRALINEGERSQGSLKAAILAMANASAKEMGYAYAADVGRIAQAVGTNLAGHIIEALQAQLSDVPADRIEQAVRAGIGQAFAAAGQAAGQ